MFTGEEIKFKNNFLRTSNKSFVLLARLDHTLMRSRHYFNRLKYFIIFENLTQKLLLP